MSFVDHGKQIKKTLVVTSFFQYWVTFVGTKHGTHVQRTAATTFSPNARMTYCQNSIGIWEIIFGVVKRISVPQRFGMHNHACDNSGSFHNTDRVQDYCTVDHMTKAH